jgi:hypothetical protein
MSDPSSPVPIDTQPQVLVVDDSDSLRAMLLCQRLYMQPQARLMETIRVCRKWKIESVSRYRRTP